MKDHRWFLLALSIAWLPACSTTGLDRGGVIIDGIEIVNLSSTEIESFQLTVPRDRIVITVSKLRMGSRSLNNVKPFPYRNNKVNLSWFQDGVKYTMESLQLSEEPDSNEAMQVTVELHDHGRVVAYRR